MYLNTSESLITIDSVAAASTEVSGVARLLSAQSPTFNYQIVYTVIIAGMDTNETEQRLLGIFDEFTLLNSTSLIDPILAQVSLANGLGNVTVFYATEPNVILWLYTTATLTSTTATSTTCCVCNLPAASDVPSGVPVGLLEDVADQVSNPPRPDLVRIECMGFKWFDTCNPICGPGYVEAEQMVCTNTSEELKMEPSTFNGTARCERDVCHGSPFNGTVPIGYEPPDPNCTDMLYQDRCNFSCSDGYTDSGITVQLECLNTTSWPVWGPVDYEFATGSGFCTEMSCDADSVPNMRDVINSSSCVGIGSRASCSPVCNASYELVEPINCTKGQFDEIPLTCIPSEHAEVLQLEEVLLIPMAIASDDPGSAEGITADWADNPSSEDAIKSSIGKMLGLLPGQIFVKGTKDLNSDWSSVAPTTTRRLTTSQGLFFEVVLQPTELVNFSSLNESISGLAAGNFIDELRRALQDAGVSEPSGLADATFVFGPTQYVSFTLPRARWIARTEWSLCSNMCGVGAHTRTVECVGAWGRNATDLCNANAAPGFTQESYMPDAEPCEQYIQCPYDWSCPSGPDPITGEGCESQASAVAIGLAVAFLCCACVLCQCARRNKEALQEKVDKMLGFEKRNIQWTRDEDRDRTHGSATLTPKGGRGVPIGPVDLDFSGTVDFELQMTVTTTASDALLVGKVYRWSDPSHQRNGAKALVIKQGTLAWQVGEHYIHGKMFIADGKRHEVSVSYSGEMDQYILRVDGVMDGRGLRAVADSKDTSLVRGTTSAPRDGSINKLHPDLDRLRRAGVEVSYLEISEDPIFDGDIDNLTWRERQWMQDGSHMAWFSFDLKIDNRAVTGERMKRSCYVYPDDPSSDQLFHNGQLVEFWSRTIQSWLPAKITAIRDTTYYDDALNFDAPCFDIYVAAAEQTVRNVGLVDLRVPLMETESASVFSQKRGSWFPARIHTAGHDGHHSVYDVKLEAVLIGSKYVKSELQRDLERYSKNARQGSEGGSGDERDDHQGNDDDLPTLKNMPAKRLRRRYQKGERVFVYRGANEGFVDAEVLQEQTQDKLATKDSPSRHSNNSPNAAARSRRSPSTSPGGNRHSPEGTQGGVKRLRVGDQHFASYAVRRVGGAQEYHGHRGRLMTVPDYVLRRSLVAPRGRSSSPAPHASGVSNGRSPARARTASNASRASSPHEYTI